MRCLLSLLLATLVSLPCFSQTATSGEVTGIITDTTGAVVTRAAIALKNLDTGESRSAASGRDGLYRFVFVRPGSYELSAAADRLRSDTSRIEVTLGQARTVNLVLKVEEPRTTVTVSDASPLVDSDNGRISFTFSNRQLESLPMPGGDLTSVAYSVPGVVLNQHPGGASHGVNLRPASGNFAMQGIGGPSTLFTLNGVDDMDPYWNVHNSGVTGLLLGANEIQEASVIQNAYDGQYGRQAGAQVSYLSKSGSNDLHGTLAYTYNGNFLNAKDYFTAPGSPSPHTVSNQYAAAIGGPVVRDKLFFFVDTEGLRFAVAGTPTVVSVPSQALEQYTLAAIQPSQVPFYKQVFSLYDSAPGRAAATPVRTGTGLLQDASGRLGCGRFSGTATGFGGTFGKDASCSDAYSTILANNTSEWLASARMDYSPSARQRMFLRLKKDRGTTSSQPSLINPLFDVVSDQPNYEAQVNHTLQVTSRLANNLILALMDYNQISSFRDLAATVAALPERINLSEGGANGSGRMTGVGAPAGFPLGNRSVNLQVVDDLSYNLGKHWVKTGVNYRYTRVSDSSFAAFSQFGRFMLRLGDFARGAESSNSTYLQYFPVALATHLRLYSVGLYVQDHWAVTPRLKLTAALRFDRNGNPDCLENCFSRFVAPFPEIAKGISVPYNESILGAVAHPFYGVELLSVQPRFSFAYSPAWAKDTVIRGGVGLFADAFPANLFADYALGNTTVYDYRAFFGGGLVNSGGAGSSPAIAAASARAFQAAFAAGATLPQLQSAVAPGPFSPPTFYSVPRTLNTPKVLEWSLELQRQIGVKNVAVLRYSGNHGYDMIFQNGALNAATNTAVYPNGFAGLPLTTPDARFADITQFTNAGFSNYHGLTASLRRTLSSRFQGQIGYTWSHALDVVSNGGLRLFADVSLPGLVNPGNIRALNYSSADYDVRHNLTLDLVWDVPGRSNRRALQAFLQGWTVAAKAQAHSGMPFSVINGELSNVVARNFNGVTVLAALTGPAVHTSCGHAAIRTPCFSASSFVTTATQTTFGNIPRNGFRGPGYVGADASLYKTVSMTERARFTVGASVFNLFNHPNLQDPDFDVTSSGFGLITSTNNSVSSPYGLLGAGSSRIVVLTAKFAF